ncbi:hypothetical protein CXB51_005298 [Gossypium anomalum]|uniref:Replication factor C C-terminal domain-containing protein n=1 Tax=Gossypium anomalum TaxID=47600 RepID=A0A8J5ZBW3_9ROSI|nr:hypothetical protein CXB51_005298 [Gossypium anomalum]
MGERRAADNKKASPKAKWPVLQPKLNLQITRLKDNDLFTNFFTPAKSKAFITAAESAGFEHQGSLGPAKGEAYRDNDRIAVNDPALADMVWQSGLSKLLFDIKIRGKVAVGLNPNIRFYRYSTHMASQKITEEAVYLCTGNPLPKDIEQISYWLLNESFAERVSETKTRKGLALIDIVREVTMFVFKIKMPLDVRVQLINDLADIEWRICFWASVAPAAILALFMEFSVESPHWLFKSYSSRNCEQYRLSFGCNDKLQLGSLIAIFTKARSALVAN